jgi:hypothetical protein
MPSIDEQWVRSQFEASKVKVAPGKAVLALLKIWEDLDLNEKQAKEAVEIFSKVALNHALAEAAKKDEKWEQLRPGFIAVGDVVRVLHDAFDGDLGRTHNGRRGKVVAVRYGDVVFKSTDGKNPVLDGAHYSPYKLEKLVS